MSFRTKKSLDMYCKSSYILLVVAACAVASGGEESSATVGKTKVISTTGTGGTSSLQRLGSGGLGSSSKLQRSSSLSSGISGNATIGSTRRLSSSSLVSSISQPNLSSGAAGGSSLPTGKVQHKYGVSAENFNVLEVPGGINPGERYVQFTNTKGKLVTYKESLFTKLKLLWNESEIGRDRYIGSDGKVHSYIYRSKPKWISGLDILNAQSGDGGSSSLPQQQRNISSSVTGLGNKSVGTQTETGNLGGIGTPKKDTGTSPTTKKYISQLNLDVDKDGNITKQNKGTNTGDGAGVQSKKRTNKGVGTQTDPSITGEGLTSLVAKSDGSQTSSGDGGSIPVKSVVYKFGKMPRFTAKGSEGDTVKPSTRSQTLSQGDVDGGSIPVKSVIYNFDKMPRFVPKGSEGDTGKTSTSVGIDVASGGEKTTKPLTDTGSGGDGKTYISTFRINLGGKGQQSSSIQTGSGAGAQGSSGSSPSGSRGASLEQQSSSSQTGSGAATQGGSGSSPSGNKGASSSGQQGQGSSSQQSASGSGAQGVSGDGSGGKKTPSSPVSGQTTSFSAQIEVKDEEGKTHQAVLVNTKGTSGGGASKKPNLSTIVEEGESSQVIGQQGKGSLVQTQTGDEKKHSSIFLTLDEKGNIVQTSGQQGQQSSSTQTGGAGEQGEASKGSKPLTGAVKGTVVTSTEVSSGIDLNEAKKQLKPVSGTTTGKETGTSDVIDLNETRKNLKPVSGTTTGKETGTSGGIDLNEAKKNLRPVSGTGDKKGTETSSGKNFDESKKSSTPVSGGGSGTQGTDGDNTAGKKTKLPLTGNDGQGSDGVKESLGANAGDEKIRYAYVGKNLEDLKNLTQQQLIDRANEINNIDITKIKFNRPSGNTQEEIDDFLANNFIISHNFDEQGNIVRTDWTQNYLNRGPVLTTHKYVRRKDGSFEKVSYETEFRPYKASDTSYTGAVPQGETAEFVTSSGKKEQSSSQIVTGGKTPLSPVGGQVELKDDDGNIYKAVLVDVREDEGSLKGQQAQGGSGGIDFDEAKKNLKPVTQPEKSDEKGSGSVTQTELQLAISKLKKVPTIGQGLYDSDSDDEGSDLSKYIVAGRGSVSTGRRNNIDFQRHVRTDEKLVNSQGEDGFVGAVTQVFNTMAQEDKKIKVSNQKGDINVKTGTDGSGKIKVNMIETTKNLEEGIGPLNIDHKFAKRLARNIKEGYEKKLQEMESKGLNQ